MEIKWSDPAKNIFDKIIENLPQFHRSIAKLLVKGKAEELSVKRQSATVEDKDVIIAFFQEVPPAFRDMMKRLFNQLKVDYSQYLND